MTSEQEKGTLGLVIAFLVMIVTVPGLVPDLMGAEKAQRRTGMREQVCPVCAGRGTVDPGFYLASPGSVITLSSTAREDCRRCNGLGTITAVPSILVEAVPAGEPHEP